MALSKYTNVDEINSRTTGTGQFLEQEDLFVVSQNTSEKIKFGECSSDIMEVILYDVNNNILPQSDNKTVRYIKFPDIQSYIIKTNTDEIAIDIEKLLNDSGYKNGIIKVNINFVRLKAGDDTEFRRMWIQEISATRSEMRILPLIVQSSLGKGSITEKNLIDFENLQDLNVDTLTYKEHLVSIKNISNTVIKNSIKKYIEKKFEKVTQFPYSEFTRILYVDFRLVYDEGTATQNFEKFIDNIVNKFKQKIDSKILTLNSSNCEYVSNKQLNQEVLSYLISSFNEESKMLRTGDIWSYSTAVETTEQIDEIMFEIGKKIETDTVQKDVQEYSVVNLSNIRLNTDTLDDFASLQQKLIETLGGTESQIPTNEIINETITRTPRPVVNQTIEEQPIEPVSGGTGGSNPDATSPVIRSGGR
jgi:hypothetical protein